MQMLLVLRFPSWSPPIYEESAFYIHIPFADTIGTAHLGVKLAFEDCIARCLFIVSDLTQGMKEEGSVPPCRVLMSVTQRQWRMC